MENQELKQRIDNYEKELTQLQQKYAVKPGISLEFPAYKILPEEVRLALLVIQKHDYKFMLSYTDMLKNQDIMDTKGN